MNAYREHVYLACSDSVICISNMNTYVFLAITYTLFLMAAYESIDESYINVLLKYFVKNYIEYCLLYSLIFKL